jgi:hypothetical protein
LEAKDLLGFSTSSGMVAVDIIKLLAGNDYFLYISCAVLFLFQIIKPKAPESITIIMARTDIAAM